MSRPWQADIDKAVNELPHQFGVVDDCIRCVHCEVLPYRAVGPCRARIQIEWVTCWACAEGTTCQGQGCLDGFLPRVVPREAS